MLRVKRYGLFILAICCSYFLQGQNHIHFRHLSPTLENTTINVSKTVQDALGNIWMVYENGILVFNGYNYKLIKNKTIFPIIKQNDYIKDIIKDSYNNIWVISNLGLITKYDSKLGRFENTIASLIKGDLIDAIFSKEGSVWLASKTGDIYRYSDAKMDSITTILNLGMQVKDITNIALGYKDELFVSTHDGKIFNYNLKSNKTDELIGPFTDYPGIILITTDQLNRLWIGTESFGLFVYDIKEKIFIQDFLFKDEKYSINKELFLALYCDSNGTIWGGTDGGGLYKINIYTGDIELIIKHDANEFSLSSNTIMGINEDNHHNIWITTNYSKLNILPSFNNNIKYHEGSENNVPLRVLCIYKSSDNVLWIGTDGSGLTKITYNPDGSANETQFFNNFNLNKGLYVQSITEDEKGNIWFGTYKNGLWLLNVKKETYEKIKIYNSKNQEATDIRTVFKDSKGRIWAGSNISINIYDSNKKLLVSFKNNNNELKGYIAESITEDENGTIWLGLQNGGLFQFNENIENIQNSNFTNHSNNKNKIHSARFMVTAKSGVIWLIDDFGKLFKYDSKNKTVKNFEHIASVNEQNFLSVLVEDNDNLWMSSKNGIHHLNLKNNSLKTYYYSDGFQDNLFLSRSAFKDNKGYLFFGGIKGFNFFNPKDLYKKESKAKLYINDIQILNQSVDSLLSPQITSGIFNVKSLKLKYNQSSFSFRFSAIDNVLNPKYYYAYRLKGFEENWVTSPSERIATYTNIPPGDYIFEVKAGTKKGNWNIDTKSIAIKIEQPFWNKPSAYFVYLFIGTFLIYGIVHWYTLKKKLFLEKVHHNKENELHELKMNFFTKMSHEIQTSITLILGPIDDMLERAKQNGNMLLKQRLDIISYNTKRLSKIARDLTLVRNKELNRLKLIVTNNDLLKHINNIGLSFKELARKRKIDFIINCPKNLPSAWYDKEKIEHVIYNLLSNAFKFTPREGNIFLNVVPVDSKKSIKLSVTDSGYGILEEELNLIFELFYQSSFNKKNEGAGIGLGLSKEIMDLHRGHIEVSSSPKDGTTFTITLPITEQAYYDEERITTLETQKPDNTNIVENSFSNNTKNELDTSKKTILIVEDNYDLQSLLKELLDNEYNVLLAENGEEGFFYAKNSFPDLILSDIMMPKMDGIEMSKKLQIDTLTMHIPIILITAKNSTISKISGLKSGAIEYINKPFNTNELILKIKNIISSREHIISKYRKEIISNPKFRVEKSQDEVFLENLMFNINERLGDPKFKMEDLADSLHMGYSSLYRKCLALTGQSLIDFVRLQRLKKAAILIVKYGYSISEAAYMTGFNDPKYFSKCFKKHFGKTPGNFKKEAQEFGIDIHLKNHKLEFVFES